MKTGTKYPIQRSNKELTSSTNSKKNESALFHSSENCPTCAKNAQIQNQLFKREAIFQQSDVHQLQGMEKFQEQVDPSNSSQSNEIMGTVPQNFFTTQHLAGIVDQGDFNPFQPALAGLDIDEEDYKPTLLYAGLISFLQGVPMCWKYIYRMKGSLKINYYNPKKIDKMAELITGRRKIPKKTSYVTIEVFGQEPVMYFFLGYNMTGDQYVNLLEEQNELLEQQKKTKDFRTEYLYEIDYELIFCNGTLVSWKLLDYSIIQERKIGQLA